MKKIKLLLTRGCNPLFLIVALLLGSLAANAANVHIVTTTADDGPGSLRAAIAAAAGDGKATAPVDTIHFSPDLKGDTIVFASTITFSKNIVIDGEENNITLSGDNKVQLFYPGNAFYVEFSNLTITAGYATSNASAIQFLNQKTDGVYIVNNVRFEANTVYGNGSGPALMTAGWSIVKHCTFIGNRHLRSTIPTAVPTSGGTAIANTNGRLEVYNSIFENNSAPNSIGGAICGRDDITIIGSVFKNNSAKGYGGAIVIRPVGTPNVKILGNTFIGNSSEGWGETVAGGGAVGTGATSGSIILAGNVFQDNTTANNAAYNEFHHLNAGVSITSAGYNVFKGEGVPASAADTWTSAATDLASANDIVDGETYRISNTSPAFSLINTDVALIEGLAFPETDLFGNASSSPYNAGADQNKAFALPDITADVPADYVNGEEENLGEAFVGETRSLSEVGFSVPSGLSFVAESAAALKTGTAFTLSGVAVGSEGAHLQLTVNFAPAAAGEYVDTLTISAAGANDFVIPLRGVGRSVPVITAAVDSIDFGRVVAGLSKDSTITVTLTDPVAALTAADFTLAGTAAAGIFSIVSVATETEPVAVALTFAPAAAAEYVDTLIIVSAHADPLRIALAGVGFTPVITAGVDSIDFGRILAGQSKDSTVTVTLTDPAAPLAATDFSLVGTAAAGIFSIASVATETEPAVVTLSFTPSVAGEYLDTLIVRAEHAEPLRIALSGAGFTPVVTSDPTALNFGEVNIGHSKDSTVTVTLTDPVAPLAAADFTLAGSSAAGIFSIASVATETEPAVVTLSFTPSVVGEYLDTLIVRAAHAAPLRIALSGAGFTPVVTSDPTALNFGEVNIGHSKDSTVTVTLTDPVAPLTAADFTLAGTAAAGIFSIASVATETEPAVVTLTFSPQAKTEYLDTLIVRAAYAAEHRIPLSGTGIGGVAIPVTKAAAAPAVSVKDRNIVVSQAPVGSVIYVYNLYGKALKTQAVTSNVETLKTASLPKSVYIVVVNNDKQEILRKKVIL